LLVGLERKVLLLVDVSETPLLGDDLKERKTINFELGRWGQLSATHDLLSTGELVSGSPESLEDDGPVGLLASNGKDDLTAVSVKGERISLATTGR